VNPELASQQMLGSPQSIVEIPVKLCIWMSSPRWQTKFSGGIPRSYECLLGAGAAVLIWYTYRNYSPEVMVSNSLVAGAEMSNSPNYMKA
jgi:hypothetical protein